MPAPRAATTASLREKLLSYLDRLDVPGKTGSVQSTLNRSETELLLAGVKLLEKSDLASRFHPDLLPYFNVINVNYEASFNRIDTLLDENERLRAQNFRLFAEGYRDPTSPPNSVVNHTLAPSSPARGSYRKPPGAL